MVRRFAGIIVPLRCLLTATCQPRHTRRNAAIVGSSVPVSLHDAQFTSSCFFLARRLAGRKQAERDQRCWFGSQSFSQCRLTRFVFVPAPDDDLKDEVLQFLGQRQERRIDARWSRSSFRRHSSKPLGAAHRSWTVECVVVLSSSKRCSRSAAACVRSRRLCENVLLQHEEVSEERVVRAAFGCRDPMSQCQLSNGSFWLDL